MFETITYQVQFWAEIGQADGGGMGYMVSVNEAKPFPTFEEAEQWLTDQGWIYDDRALRRLKPNNGYGLARTRRHEESNAEKWVSPRER